MNKDRARILHILEAIDKIEALVSKGRDLYDSDETIQDSIIRKLEIIGEAVKSLSPEIKEKYPEIPWKQLGGMRDVLIHQYFGVDLDTVWDIANKRIPQLSAVFMAIMKEIEM